MSIKGPVLQLVMTTGDDNNRDWNTALDSRGRGSTERTRFMFKMAISSSISISAQTAIQSDAPDSQIGFSKL